MGVVLATFLSCSDFEEINVDPTAANATQVQPEYFINSSISGAQQNPHISERIFVLYWIDAGHMSRVGTLSEGSQNDGWTSDYYKRSQTCGSGKENTECKSIAYCWKAR